MSREIPNGWLLRLPNAHHQSETLRQQTPDLRFAMETNGYVECSDGTWQEIDYKNLSQLRRDAEHLESVFGDQFLTPFPTNNPKVILARALNQAPVLDVVRKYREVDETQARRISFLLGGIAWLLKNRRIDDKGIENAVAFAASMTKLGKPKSGEAIAAAMAMYVLSGEPLRENDVFKGHVYRMAEAIAEETITPPWETANLGISQATRLLGFIRKMRNAQDVGQQDLGQPVTSAIAHHKEAFATFPTIGAEFHILRTEKINDTFWQRVAILNMSQYQNGSPIPFSRAEGKLIEIRMNPSIYPVATATWNLMRLLLPELNGSYFTMTINRRDRNFSKATDKDLITLLHGLGNLRYAAFFKGVPSVVTPRQVNFGDRYLGRTVRVTDERFSPSGGWYLGLGKQGQLNICTGFGDLFPGLAFYLSMGLAEPAILERDVLGYDIRKATSLTGADKFGENDIRNIFEALNRSIVNNQKLNTKVGPGERILEELKP